MTDTLRILMEAQEHGEQQYIYSEDVPVMELVRGDLDGRELNLTVYTINGNNFFKLRDLMQAIDVYVGYDNATKNITLDTSNGYVEP